MVEIVESGGQHYESGYGHTRFPIHVMRLEHCRCFFFPHLIQSINNELPHIHLVSPIPISAPDNNDDDAREFTFFDVPNSIYPRTHLQTYKGGEDSSFRLTRLVAYLSDTQARYPLRQDERRSQWRTRRFILSAISCAVSTGVLLLTFYPVLGFG